MSVQLVASLEAWYAPAYARGYGVSTLSWFSLAASLLIVRKIKVFDRFLLRSILIMDSLSFVMQGR